MHDALAMHVLQRPSNLVNVLPDLFLREIDLFLHCSFHDQLQIAFFSPLNCYEQFVQLVVNEPVEVFHDVGMI